MSFGGGLVRALAMTAKNFVGSYFDKKRLVTVQYPEERLTPKENFRNIPFLIFDGDAETGLRCTACKICEQECPPQCIYIEVLTDEKGISKKKPKVFDIDMSVCMNCGICAEVGPFDSIKMDSEYELSTANRFVGLLADKGRLGKSNEYYHQIKSTEATAVDERLAAKKKPAAAPAPVKPAEPAPAAPAAAAAPAAPAPAAAPAAAAAPTTEGAPTPAAETKS
ncbi:MAG: 4Fe-4S dicluster domain-containing protein [Deltaproteobacteria bacterium]|nr:4Fe-4S dicluster domain-containing protein [Deltaproteobacteria bacterium]